MKFTFIEQFGKHLFLSLFRVLEYKLLKLLEMQDCTATLEDRQFLTKQNLVWPYDPVITLLGIYPKGLKMHVQY